MKFSKLFTWLDVRRVTSRYTNYGSKFPEGVVRIRCFSDALEIGLDNEEQSIENAQQALKEWFGDWYQEDQSLIQLDLGDATLPVEFIPGEENDINDVYVRPFWEEIAYINSDSELKDASAKPIKLPEAYNDKPKLIAFYSFKGGVGRTLSLAAHLFALLDRAALLDQPINILVIDADLEAPGLTYWNRSEKQQPTVSFIDFLESYHYSPIDIEQTLSIFASEVKKSPKREGKSTIYFLPACIDDNQLLDMPIMPEQLVTSPNGAWEYGNAIHRLGKAIGVDYVFIDLRAGLSKISSPIIFDPRFQRFLVTTITEQSVIGTSLVLKQMGQVAPSKANIDNEIYYNPSLIISMLTPELKSLPAFEDASVRFQSAYVQPEENNIYSTRLSTQETYFAQELLYINNWDEAHSKLNSTSVMEITRSWAEEEIVILKTG
jgi:MinD-like ATPase involved in chromosome partitioning or flagellar assembly